MVSSASDVLSTCEKKSHSGLPAMQGQSPVFNYTEMCPCKNIKLIQVCRNS